jgi:hypothetical protein
MKVKVELLEMGRGLETKVVEVEAESVEDAWVKLQRIDGGELPDQLQCRSASVGDIFKPEGQDNYFICDIVGFEEVSPEVAEKWRQLEHRDRMMGWGFVTENSKMFEGVS